MSVLFFKKIKKKKKKKKKEGKLGRKICLKLIICLITRVSAGVQSECYIYFVPTST